MTLKELKTQIESGIPPIGCLVFFCEEYENSSMNLFIPHQYIDAIAKLRGLEIHYVDEITNLLKQDEDLFGVEEDNPYLNVYITDTFDCDNFALTETNNLIVVTHKFSSDAVRINCAYNTVTVPKLTAWQIKDYLYSMLPGVSKEKLDWLQTNCKNNIYKIQQEIEKLLYFKEAQRDLVFDKFLEYGMYTDLTAVTTFNLTNALSRRDANAVKVVYKDVLSNKETTSMGILMILLNTFRNLLLVQLSPNPTSESTGIPEKQLYAIKKIPRVYTQQELINIFEFLSDIDRKIKSGDMWMDVLVDYIIVKILS